MNNMLKNKLSTSMTRVAGELKQRVRSGTCGRVHAQKTGLQLGVRSCIMPGLPTHLVQELNDGTVPPIRRGFLSSI